MMVEKNETKERLYLDWNIFNKLESLTTLKAEEKEGYEYLDLLIMSGNVIAPYSNAHIDDLIRGYEKDPSYTPGHLSNITRLTNNVCIAQYWNESKVRWHFRDPEEFLHSRIEESDSIASTYGALYDSLNEPLLSVAFDMKKLSQQMIPVPETFKKAYPLIQSSTSCIPGQRSK